MFILVYIQFSILKVCDKSMYNSKAGSILLSSTTYSASSLVLAQSLCMHGDRGIGLLPLFRLPHTVPIHTVRNTTHLSIISLLHSLVRLYHVPELATFISFEYQDRL